MSEIEDLDRPKYVVFKREDFYLALGTGTVGQCQEVDDAVVIRQKDPFAATALYTYSNTIMSFLELMEGMTQVAPIPGGDRQRLLDIADYFAAQAMESEKIKDKRLPN